MAALCGYYVPEEVLGLDSPTRERSRNPVDGTTWEFLRGGWWVLHVVAIVGVYYLGRMFVR